MIKLKKDTVYQDVKLDILSGRYPVGAKLPKELDFAAERKVSFITMRSALKMLEAEGLIARIPSKGTFVIRNTPEAPAKKVRHILLLQVDYNDLKEGGNLFQRDLILGTLEQSYLDGCKITHGDFTGVEKLPERFAAGEFDGIIWDRPDEELAPLLEQLHRIGVPQITVNRVFDQIPSIGCNYPEGMRVAMRYLRSIGHRHIGLIDLQPKNEVFRERQNAFCEELRFDGIADPERYLLRLKGDRASDYLLIAELMREVPQITALLVSNVYLYDLNRYLEASGMAVPQRLSVIQQGEIEEFSRETESPFSIFTDPRRIIGSRALVTVLRQLDGNPIPARTELIVGELIIRKSCALPYNFRETHGM